jgi:hypothetical protein
MKANRLAVAVALAVVAAGSMVVAGKASSGFVTRSGTQLMLGGASYRFKGLNIYQANVRDTVSSTYNCNGGSGAPPYVDQSLSLIGNAANAFRSWFFQAQATTSGVRDWTAFDQTLSVAASHNVKVVVVLASESGACELPNSGLAKDYAWYTGGYKTSITPGYTQAYRDYVHDVATRYAGNTSILMWQLMNEAAVGGCPSESAGASALRSFTDDMTTMIKGIDANHLISLGTGLQGGCGYSLSGMTGGVNDYQYVHASSNLDFCEYHDYNVPTIPLFTLEANEMTACAADGKAFFVGEMGIDQTDTNRPSEINAKLSAQFGNGSQGELVWEWGITACDNYCVRAQDPVLGVLATY